MSGVADSPTGQARALGDQLVLDLTDELFASLAAVLLADFGARVVRVEPVHRGRAVGPRREDARPWDYESELIHRNKESVAVDLESAEGQQIVRELARRADVLVTDWPVSRLQRLGLDRATLARENPRLIHARGSGFGPRGPDADLPPRDELAAARTGMMPILPQPGQPPVYAGAGRMYTAGLLAMGIGLALCHRDRTGQGQGVDTSLLAGNMYGASLDLQAFLAMGGERFLHPVDRMDAGNPMSGVLYPTSDDRWVCLTMPDTDRWWPALAEMVGVEADDPRFDTHDKRCGENRLELIRVLEERFRTRTAAEWRREIDARQLSADIIERFDYPARDPQARRNRYILEVDRPGIGSVLTVGFPVFMSETPARLRTTAPGVGQHSAVVLKEILGYSEDRITELTESGVVRG